MVLSRHCDSCNNPITTKYYDLMITPKIAALDPEQDAKNAYGDYCIECINNGEAIKQLLLEFKIEP